MRLRRYSRTVWLRVLLVVLSLYAAVAAGAALWLRAEQAHILEDLERAELLRAGAYDAVAIETGYRVDCEKEAGTYALVSVYECAQMASQIERSADAATASVYMNRCVERTACQLKECLVADANCTFLGRRSLWRPWLLAQ